MNQKIIKEGVVTSSPKKLKGGFNLNQFVLKFLEWIGFAATVDCCTYYPTYPVLDVANIASPTEEEMANVPLYSMFLTISEDLYYLHFKYSATNTDIISTND